jgi:hypothetical protein
MDGVEQERRNAAGERGLDGVNGKDSAPGTPADLTFALTTLPNRSQRP